MSDFKPGDVVRLLSSPQKMVVQVANGTSSQIACVWIEDYGVPHRETYLAVVLELAEDEDPIKAKMLKRKKPADTLFDENDPALKEGD